MKKQDQIEMTRVAFIGSGMVVFLIGILLTIGSELDATFGVICLLAIVTLSANLFYHIGQTKEDSDERLAMIGNRAMSLSWFATLITMVMLLSLESMAKIGISVGQVLGIGLMIMITTMVLSNEIQAKKGGAES
jgi:hypothetical protein